MSKVFPTRARGRWLEDLRRLPRLAPPSVMVLDGHQKSDLQVVAGLESLTKYPPDAFSLPVASNSILLMENASCLAVISAEVELDLKGMLVVE